MADDDNLLTPSTFRKRQASIKHRYIFFSSLLLLIILGVGSIAFAMYMVWIERSQGNSEVIQAMERLRLVMGAAFDGKIALVRKTADSILIRQHLINPTDLKLRNMALEERAAYRKAFGTNNLFWTGVQGEYIPYREKTYTMDPTANGYKLYGSVVKADDSVQLDAVFTIGRLKNTLWIDAPVLENKNKTIGFVRTGIEINDFVKDFYRGYPGTAELYFFNTAGEIIGAKEDNLIKNKTNMTDLFGQDGMEILTRVRGLSTSGEISSFETKDRKAVFAIESIPRLDWHIVAIDFFNNKKVLPKDMIMHVIATLAIIFIFFVVLNVYVVKIMNPLDTLVKTVNKTLFEFESKQERFTSEVETLSEFIKMSITDPLTGVHNRRYLDMQLKTLLNSLSVSNSEISLLLIDVDCFKKYNDTYGHDVGDNCLRAIASALAQCINRKEDFVARYGGEEFAVVLPYADKAGAQIMANRLLEKVRECNIPHSASAVADHVTISIGGIIGVVSHLRRVQTVIKLADEALYESKGGGRNRCTLKTLE